MGKTIILTSNNAFYNQGWNTFVYSFPNGQVSFVPGDKIALSGLSTYYSWNNITNNVNSNFAYTWIEGNTFTVNLPSGFYTISDINAYLQSVMYSNSHYLVNANTGSYEYFVELTENQTQYACQLNLYAVGNTLPSGYAIPSGANWALPTQPKTPQFTVPSTQSIASIIGFSANTFPIAAANTTYSMVSNVTPQVTPITSVVVTCSLVQNRLAIPQTLLTAFSPDVDYGSLINVQPRSECFIDIAPGQYSSVTVQLWTNALQPLPAQDNNTVILLDVDNY